MSQCDAKQKTIPMEDLKKEVSSEELAAEQAALADKKEDEIRNNIITEYSFDEVDDADRITKLVTREMEHGKKLSSAIGQKIKWRTEATKPKEVPVITPPQEKKNDVQFDPEIVDKRVLETLDKRDLEAMDLPDEVKSEISKVSKLQNIPLKQALRDPYIVFKISEYEKENKTDEASITRNNKTGGKKVASFDNPPDVDMSTQEGRDKWEAYKKDLIKKGY